MIGSALATLPSSAWATSFTPVSSGFTDRGVSGVISNAFGGSMQGNLTPASGSYTQIPWGARPVPEATSLGGGKTLAIGATPPPGLSVSPTRATAPAAPSIRPQIQFYSQDAG